MEGLSLPLLVSATISGGFQSVLTHCQHMRVKVAAKTEGILRLGTRSFPRISNLKFACPQTSNVFVANLPAHVNEQTLGTFFARAGPVGSVSQFGSVVCPRSY